jgi:hypothetical protein
LVNPDLTRVIVNDRYAHVGSRDWIALGEESLAARSTQMLAPVLIGRQDWVRQSMRHKKLQGKVCGSSPLLYRACTGSRIKRVWLALVSVEQFVSGPYVHHRHVKVLNPSPDVAGVICGVPTLFLNPQEYKWSVGRTVTYEPA